VTVHSIELSEASHGLIHLAASNKLSKRTKAPRRPALSPVPSFPSNPQRRDRREGEPEPDLAALGIQKRRLKIPSSLVASIDLTAAARASSFRSPRKPAILFPTVPAPAPCG